MSDATQINSSAYWQGRFSADWEACAGPAQSRFFARLAMDNLPRWLLEQLSREGLTLCDWGCAQGDGTDVLAGYMDPRRLAGVDFSSVAVEQAARRYPAIRFLYEDWLSAQGDPQERFDLVFSSNTLEHFHEPNKVLSVLCRHARKGLILVLPYRELERIGEHFFTFLPNNIPLLLENGFRLLWSRIVDCRSYPVAFWSGDQVVLVYADRKWVDRLGLTLADCEVAQEDSRAESLRLRSALGERETQVAELGRILAERYGRIAELSEVVAERIAGLTEAFAARNELIGGLQQSLAERDGLIARLTESVGEREWHNRRLQQRVQDLAARNELIGGLQQSLAERDGQIACLMESLGESEWHNRRLQQRVQDLTASTSWRVTAPLRWLTGAAPVRFLAVGAKKAIHAFRPGRIVGFAESALVRVANRFRMNPIEYSFDQFVISWTTSRPIRWQRTHVPYTPGLVSIVLPSFNGSHLVGEALESILSQTYGHIEIIAINDGSTDETGSILRAYAKKDSRVNVFDQANQKLPKTLSRGFRLARGEFLTWTSVDNRLKPQCVELLVRELQRHPTWDMVYANIDIIGDDGKPLRSSSWYDGYQSPAGSEHIHLPRCASELNTWANNYVGAAFMYRSRVAWVIGDYSANRFCTEDYDYWMRVNEVMKLRHTDFDVCIYEYRFHEKSLTSRDEELGITANRVKLMVFDEFRRSHLLSRTVWVITTDGGAANEALAAGFRAHLDKRKEVVLDELAIASLNLPRLWLTLVLVHFADSEALPEVVAHLSDTASCMLVSSWSELPENPPERWDLCVTTNRVSPDCLPRVTGGYQGWWSVPEMADLVTLCDVRGKNKQLALIETETAQLLGSSVSREAGFLSVVVCTYQRSAKFEGAIRSLLMQTLAADRYEIVVVNNEPAEPYPCSVVEGLLKGREGDAQPRVLLVDCPQPGLSYARNAGLAASSGDYVVFMDDDAYADPDCLNELRSAFAENPKAGVIGGHITLNVPVPRPPVCPPGREGLWSQLLTSHTRYTEVTRWEEFPYGALWAARRVALFEIGGFRCNFGRVGGDYGGGEEIVAALLASQLGYSIGIEPRASVLHDVDLDRFTERHVLKTMQAGFSVNYDMQVSLYLPNKSSLRSLTWEFLSASCSSIKLAVKGRFVENAPRSDVLYANALARARAVVLKKKFVDSTRRFRTPRVCRD